MGRHAAPEQAPTLYRLLRALLRPLFLGVLRPTVEGVDRVPRTGPAILCANHMSAIDPVLVPIVVPRPIVYLAKREYFLGPFRWLFDSLGVVPVAREGGSAAEASLERATEVLRSGGVLSLFPEGTRSPDGRLYRGKTGPVRLARRTGAPIVPIGLVGTRAVMPPHTHLPRRGPVTVRFGDPLYVAANDAASIRATTDALMRTIQQLTGQTYVDAYASEAAERDDPQPPHEQPSDNDSETSHEQPAHDDPQVRGDRQDER